MGNSGRRSDGRTAGTSFPISLDLAWKPYNRAMAKTRAQGRYRACL